MSSTTLTFTVFPRYEIEFTIPSSLLIPTPDKKPFVDFSTARRIAVFTFAEISIIADVAELSPLASGYVVSTPSLRPTLSLYFSVATISLIAASPPAASTV